MSNPKTILLIDDEIDLQQLVKIALKSKGYNIETANNGLEGLAKLETMNPDLIILDMNMPKMGGVEFYQKICDGTDRPRYPVLVLTARANMEQLFKELNIDGFMAKPFEIDDLLREADTIIRKEVNAGIRVSPSGARESRKVCLVDNSPEMLNKIGPVFTGAGYTVSPARSGTEGIELIAGILPDVALVNLGLTDISGDLVVVKLKLMAKTRGVKFILYSDTIAEKTIITQKIGEKQGIDRLVPFTTSQDLLKVVNELLRG